MRLTVGEWVSPWVEALGPDSRWRDAAVDQEPRRALDEAVATTDVGGHRAGAAVATSAASIRPLWPV